MDRRDMLKTSAGAAGFLALPPLLRDRLAAESPLRRRDLEVARRAAAWIASTRIETPAGVTWAWNPTEAPGEAQTNLYSGSPGVVLFFLELHHATGDEADLAEARRGADHLIAAMQADPDAFDTGLYTGLAGLAFTFDEVHRATGDPRYREATLEAEARLLERSAPTRTGRAWSPITDIVSGNAGTLLWMLRAWERDRDRAVLDLAVQVGDGLIDAAEPAEGGLLWAMGPSVPNRYPNFSHGTAGVSYALATLHQATGEERFLAAALAGARYLDTVRAPDAEGCRVFHHEPGGEELYYLSWCHGPPGTARLARRLELVTGESRWRDDVACWARGVLATGAPETRSPGYWNNVSQCCGDAGVGEFFLSLIAEDPRPEYREMVDRVADRLRREATEDDATGGLHWVQAEHRVRPGWTVPQTGFMQGAAGIGTFFLHLDGDEVGRRRRVLWPDSPWSA